MKVFLALGLIAFAGSAASADIVINDLHQAYSGSLSRAGWGNPTDADPLAIYGNLDNYTGFSVSNGGAAPDPANALNTITRLVGDDAHMTRALTLADSGTTMWFTVGNLDPAAVTARPRIRIYDTTGAGGGPGTVLAGFTFNPITFAAGSANVYFFGTGALSLPQDIWIGTTFDNNAGATGATVAQMNNLGVLTFNPATVGSSADKDFLTTANGSFFANNPAGSVRNSPFLGNPFASYGYQLTPAPGSIAILGLGGLLAARRRRS